MANSKAPPQTFWKDDLGLNIDELVEGFDAAARDEWIDHRTGRQLAVIAQALGVDGDSTRSRKASLRDAEDEIVPFFLVEHFSRFKSKVAVVEYAKETLPEELLGQCMKTEDDGDRTASLSTTGSNDFSPGNLTI